MRNIRVHSYGGIYRGRCAQNGAIVVQDWQRGHAFGEQGRELSYIW